MLTCKEASYLASKAMDTTLSWRERTGLWLHISMCKLCRRYVGDIKKLRAMMRRSGKRGIEMLPEPIKLSEQAHDRIEEALNKALHRD